MLPVAEWRLPGVRSPARQPDAGGERRVAIPPVGVLGIGGGYYGAFPLEAAIFADAGVAWTESDRPTFFGGHRPGVSSAGVALRANLLGFAIGELDVVRPFQRPAKGWLAEVSLIPGF